MKKVFVMTVFVLILPLMFGADCYNDTGATRSVTGVKETIAEIKTGSDGLTSEQRNVKKRLEQENIPGKIQHLYVVSSFSGDCILYSTVQGKVTSSGKRLSPTNVVVGSAGDFKLIGYKIPDGRITGEVLQDDGTYGSSIEYLYWWDSRGMYHQHYVSGGQIIHVSDSPMSFPKIMLNLETQVAK